MQNGTRRFRRRTFAYVLHVGATLLIAASRLAAQSASPDAGRAPTGAGPAAVADSDVLQLADVYRLVTVTNPRLEAARAIARAAEARVPGARVPPDPQFQLGFMNYTIPGLAPMAAIGMTQLQLMQMIPVAGKLGLAGRSAASQATAARERAEDTRWELRSRAAMAFYDLYQTDKSLEVAVNTRQLVANIAKTAQSMYEVGEGRQADVLRAQVEVARMDEDITRMRAMRLAMAARLAAVLDVRDSTFATPALPVFPAVLPALDSLQRLAVANRPMLKAGEADVGAANAQARLAAREIWPDLTVGVQYGQRGGEMGTERMGSLMVGAAVPVFARSRQLKMREEAVAMRQMAEADLRAMRADTRGRVAELYADIVRARNLAALYRGSVLPQAQAAVTSSLASYRVGDVNFMTLLDNQMTVNRYQQELYTLDAEQGKALAELEMLIGRELFDVGAASMRAAGSGQ